MNNIYDTIFLAILIILLMTLLIIKLTLKPYCDELKRRDDLKTETRNDDLSYQNRSQND